MSTLALKNDDATTVATLYVDTFGGVTYAGTKLILGDVGDDDGPVSTANPLPVTGDVEVTGTVTVTGVATAIKQSDGSQKSQIVDGSGNVIASVGNALSVNIASGSVVTQYTEDAAAASDPVGNALIMVRADTLAAVTTADGDNIAARATNKGEQYVKHVDSIPVTDNGGNLSVDDGGGSLTVDGTVAVSGGTIVVTDGSGSITVDGTVAVTDGGSSLTVDGSVTLGAGTAIIGKFGIDQTTDGTTNRVSLAAHQTVDQTKIGGVSVSVGAGTVDTGTQRVTFPTDGNGRMATVDTVTNITNQGNIVDNAGFTDGTTRLMMGGFIFDDVAGTALTENDAAAGRVNANRAIVVTFEDNTTRGRRSSVGSDGSLQVRDAPSTAGGLTPYKLISAATTNDTNVKASAGQLYSVVVTNSNASARYLKLYDKATAPTVGSDTPVWTLLIPGGSSGLALNVDKGLAFALGIGIGLTTGAADNNASAVASGEIIVNLGYK